MANMINRRKRKAMRTHAWLGQWLAALICATGIGIELATRAGAGHILITLGAVCFAIFTKLRREK